MTATGDIPGKITIFLGDNPINKVQAAHALNRVDGPGIRIYDTEQGWTQDAHYIDLDARRYSWSDVQVPPQVSWSSLGMQDVATARLYAQMMTLAVDVMDLADLMLTADK